MLYRFGCSFARFYIQGVPEMNLELKQLKILLTEYDKRYEIAKQKFDDPEYLAWISTHDKDFWPTAGEFVKARQDKDFRSFRVVYREVATALQPVCGCPLDPLPYDSRKEYRDRFVKENPDCTIESRF